MRILTSSILTFILSVALLHADSTASSASKSFLDVLEDFDGNPDISPEQVSETFVAESVDYVFDGIPTTRMDFQHPSVSMTNGVSIQWSIRPTAASSSVSLVHRDFQNTVVSISLYKKGTYPKSVDPKDFVAVAAGIVEEFGSNVIFEDWMSPSFSDPSIPSNFHNYNPRSIGFLLSNNREDPTVFRIYYLSLKKWTLVVEFRTQKSNYQATFPAFSKYMNRMTITEN